MTIRRNSLLIGLAGTLILAASGCAQSVSGPVATAAPAKKDIVLVQGADIARFDPHLTSQTVDTVVTYNIFDTLVQRDAALKLQPALATEWKLVNDTTWQFKIRPGVKFHDGESLTAAVVKASLDRTGPQGDPKYVTRSTFTSTKQVDVVDELTVNIVTTFPDPLLPDRLASFGGQIVPKDYLAKVGADAFNAKPIGTGAYKFVEWVKDDRLVLEANKEWWGPKVAFEKVTVKPLPEAAARVASLLKGEADVITSLPTDSIAQVKAGPNTAVVGALYTGFFALMTNYQRPFPLNNKDFHQAMSLAIDRQAIVRDIWRDQGKVLNGIYPEGNNAYDPSLPPLAFDKTKAKEALTRSGYKGEEIVFETTQGVITNDRLMAEAIVAMWKEVGINGKLEIVENSVRAQKLREKTFKGVWWSDPTDTLLDPDGLVYRLQGPGDRLLSYWRNPEWDTLMEQARTTVDLAKRKALYQQAHKIYLEHLQWIPLFQPIVSYGLQRFVDWKPRGDQVLLLSTIRVKG